MKQLKFDEDGVFKPHKIRFEVKHDEDTEKAIKEAELEKELLNGLNVLAPGDRNIKALTIYCNPNYTRGSDTKISKLCGSILEKLIVQEIVIKETDTNGKDMYSLSNKKNIRKKGV